MTTDVPLRCACGALRGVAREVGAGAGHRVVCYCDDCQAFAHFLGRADRILDAHGGTDVFQMSPARIELTKGKAHLACLRLTRKGVLRWYAACCNSPVGNTFPTRQIPFVGLILDCADPLALDRTLDEVFGPVRARVHARFATGEVAEPDTYDRAPISLILRFAGSLLTARIRGEHKKAPTFFDAKTGKPTVVPRILRS